MSVRECLCVYACHCRPLQALWLEPRWGVAVGDLYQRCSQHFTAMFTSGGGDSGGGADVQLLKDEHAAVVAKLTAQLAAATSDNSALREQRAQLAQADERQQELQRQLDEQSRTVEASRARVDSLQQQLQQQAEQQQQQQQRHAAEVAELHSRLAQATAASSGPSAVSVSALVFHSTVCHCCFEWYYVCSAIDRARTTHCARRTLRLRH